MIRCGDHIFAAQRGKGGASAFKWEFPGGKVEPGEVPRDALSRELAEELGVEAQVQAELGTYCSMLGDRQLLLQCFWCEITAGTPTLKEHVAMQWLRLQDLSLLDWAAPDLPAVQDVVRLLGGSGGCQA